MNTDPLILHLLRQKHLAQTMRNKSTGVLGVPGNLGFWLLSRDFRVKAASGWHWTFLPWSTSF